jgi:hypothetical protein
MQKFEASAEGRFPLTSNFRIFVLLQFVLLQFGLRGITQRGRSTVELHH